MTQQTPAAPRHGGARYMMASAFFFSLMSLLVKAVGTRLPSQEVVFVRALVSLAVAAVMVRRAGIRPWGNRRGLLVVRGLVGFTALSCFFYALVHLPLAEATVIQYTNPVWTAWLSWWLLGEGLTLTEAGLSLASLAGVVLVARPSVLFGHGAALAPFAVAVALAGSLGSAAAYVSVRKLGESEHPLVIVFYFTLVTVPAALPGTLAHVVAPNGAELALLLGVGVTAVLGQLYLTRGLQREPAGRATALGYVQIVFAAGWGALFFREYPDHLTVAGAALVMVSVLMLARRHARPRPRIELGEESTAEA